MGKLVLKGIKKVKVTPSTNSSSTNGYVVFFPDGAETGWPDEHYIVVVNSELPSGSVDLGRISPNLPFGSHLLTLPEEYRFLPYLLSTDRRDVVIPLFLESSLEEMKLSLWACLDQLYGKEGGEEALWNEAERILEEVLAQTVDLVPEEDRGILEDAIRRALPSGSSIPKLEFGGNNSYEWWVGITPEPRAVVLRKEEKIDTSLTASLYAFLITAYRKALIFYTDTLVHEGAEEDPNLAIYHRFFYFFYKNLLLDAEPALGNSFWNEFTRSLEAAGELSLRQAQRGVPVRGARFRSFLWRKPNSWLRNTGVRANPFYWGKVFEGDLVLYDPRWGIAFVLQAEEV